MANFAIGNDIVFIPDFNKSFTSLFKNKVYTADEIFYCERFDNSLLRFASTWAAKEAVYKAIKQLDTTALPWKKIEITRDKIAGKPKVILHTNKAPLSISLSISHDGDYAWAVVIVEKI
ncbi:holo-ACP synthase [Pedobacter sp. Du54]|uniref:holo-ACP synthase n=1 Tax=Pedobacter anseongensis TaxID=3133439 RepID=UPI00309E9855